MPKFLLRGFSRPREAIVASLGTLERETLAEIWRQKEASVRQISLAFEERIAYTTIMTTLDRLYKKGFLDRRKEGRAYFYAARFSPAELERGLAEDVFGGLLAAETKLIEPVLACFVDAVSDRDRELLDDLERLVKEKRREIQNEKEEK